MVIPTLKRPLEVRVTPDLLHLLKLRAPHPLALLKPPERLLVLLLATRTPEIVLAQLLVSLKDPLAH